MYTGTSNYTKVLREKLIIRAADDILNPCPAEEIKMSHSFLIFNQSDYLIQIVDINSHI